MDVTVHYPSNDRAKSELAERVAKIRVQAIIRRIDTMPCSAEQKAAALEAVIQQLKRDIISD